MKRLALAILSVLGLPGLLRLLHRKELTILLSHGVAPRVDWGIYNYRGKFLEPAPFERHVAYLGKHYSILPLEEAVQRLFDGTLPRNALALTFDDGYRNFYEYAFPILEKYGAPATMFLATDFVFKKEPLWVDRLEYAIGALPGSRSERIQRDLNARREMKNLPDADRLRRLAEIEKEAGTRLSDFEGERVVYAPLSSEEIRELSRKGVRFGAHTASHPILSRLGEDAQEREIAQSLEAVQGVCDPASLFAYPNGQPGDWTLETEAILQRRGFAGALTTVEGLNGRTSTRFALKRIAVDGIDGATFPGVASGLRLLLRNLWSDSSRRAVGLPRTVPTVK